MVSDLFLDFCLTLSFASVVIPDTIASLVTAALLVPFKHFVVNQMMMEAKENKACKVKAEKFISFTDLQEE